MTWNPDSITQDKLHDWRRAAEHAWSDEVRPEDSRGHPQPSAGCCYVTSKWIANKINGHVGTKEGHFFAVSPDKNYVIDLTGDQDASVPVKGAPRPQDAEDEPYEYEAELMRHRPGPVIYTHATNPLYRDFRIANSVDGESGKSDTAQRTQLFAERANAALEGKLLKQADSGGSGSDAYPGEGPQAENEFNLRDFHDPVIDDLNLSMEEPVEHEYQFVYANGQLQVSPTHTHGDLLQQSGILPDHQGPMAVGYVNLRGRDALWSVETNIGLRGLVKILKDYTKQQKWQWGGLTDSTGNPVHDDFGAKKSFWYGWRDGKLKLSAQPFWGSHDEIEVVGKIAHYNRAPNPFALDGLEEWANDFGYRIESKVAANDWFAPSYMIPDDAKQQIHDWAQTLPWPEESKFAPPERYHVTGVYSPSGFNDPSHHEWLNSKSGLTYPAQTVGVDNFSPSKVGMGAPVVLRVHHPQLEKDTERLIEEAQRRGLPVSRFPGGYKPHITVGHSPIPIQADHPGLSFPVGPLRDLHSYYDELKRTTSFHFAEYPGGTDMNDRIKNKEWPTTYDKGDPEAEPGKTFDGEPQGELTCPYCNEVLPNFKAYVMHTKEHQDPEMQPIDDGHFPTIRPLDEPLGFGTQSQPTAIPVIGAIQRESWDFVTADGWQFEAAGGEGKDLLQAPIPFIYDIEKDYITVGHPGMHTHDVMPPGEGATFTPGGLVEGEYLPKGKMVIRTNTTIPWSSYHMMQLWYYSHPGLEITSLEIENQQGETHKVASADVGTYVKSITAADGAAWTASQALKEAGGKVYVVGGAIRDALLQKEPKDIDLMVSGLPSEDVNNILEHLPGRVDLTGKRFGVYRYHTKGQEVEIALPRTDNYETGGTRGQGQITVDHHLPIEKDLQRRDFTANSMAVDLDSGRLIDPYNGSRDIESHTLRTTHPGSFDEDPTRLVRALTMHSRHGLVPDEQTRKEMEEHAHRLDQESPDALKQQLEKFLVSANPASGVRLAQETEVLKHLFPELANNFDYDQNNVHHNYSLGEHSLNVFDKISQKTKDPDLRLAALLHDTGKPASAWIDPNTGQQHFYAGMVDGQPVGADHAKVGADLAENRLRETFNYPVTKIRNIHNLISSHMFPQFSSLKGARKFLNKTGDAADDLLTLREADSAGKGTDVSYKTPVDQMRGLVEQVRTAGDPTSQSAISVNGSDLLNLGMKPGPAVGKVLKNLTDEVVANPASNDRETLLQLAQEYIRALPEV